ncbi:hypothetical protein COOONC_27462 [Cooperia oncophora]
MGLSERLLEAEALWNHCKEIFKQSANHALFRTHYMMSAYTSRFARLLEEVSHLPHGDYMLVNRNDGVVKILPQLKENMSV